MLQIPKAGDQIPEQDPEEMGSTYFSLVNHINLAQVSQKQCIYDCDNQTNSASAHNLNCLYHSQKVSGAH
nr:hypothetical protein Iba_chr10dCG15780 [Ipomoea batatas]